MALLSIKEMDPYLIFLNTELEHKIWVLEVRLYTWAMMFTRKISKELNWLPSFAVIPTMLRVCEHMAQLITKFAMQSSRFHYKTKQWPVRNIRNAWVDITLKTALLDDPTVLNTRLFDSVLDVPISLCFGTKVKFLYSRNIHSLSTVTRSSCNSTILLQLKPPCKKSREMKCYNNTLKRTKWPMRWILYPCES